MPSLQTLTKTMTREKAAVCHIHCYNIDDLFDFLSKVTSIQCIFAMYILPMKLRLNVYCLPT